MYLRDPHFDPDDAYRKRVVRFFQANGIDPHSVVARPGFVLAGRHIEYTEFVTAKRRDGSLLRVLHGHGYAKRKRRIRSTVRWGDVR